MAESKPTKKQKILKFLAISSVIISLVLSSIALYYTSDIGDLESGVDGEQLSQNRVPVWNTWL